MHDVFIVKLDIIYIRHVSGNHDSDKLQLLCTRAFTANVCSKPWSSEGDLLLWHRLIATSTEDYQNGNYCHHSVSANRLHMIPCIFPELEPSVNNIANLISQLRHLEVECHDPQARLIEVLEKLPVECHDPQQRLIEELQEMHVESHSLAL